MSISFDLIAYPVSHTSLTLKMSYLTFSVPIGLLVFLWFRISLLNFYHMYHVKTMGCLVTVLMSSDVIAISCITFCEGILECLFIYIAIHIHIIYSIVYGIWSTAFNVFLFSVFHRNLISCITRSLHKRKTFIEFRPQNGSFFLPSNHI